MNTFLVLEFRIWFLLVLLVVLAGLGFGAWWYTRKWIAEREARIREHARADAEREAMTRRNRMLIRLDHELKNPLTALRTSAATVRELIREDAPDPDEIAPVVRQIDISSRRVARLLADLRKLADVESRDIEFSRVDLDRLIHQAVEDARTAPGAEDRMIVATVARAPWKLPAVAGEEDLLLSAILNLLGNAIKYSNDTDVVELRANEQIINQHRWVVVEVADTGQGIPADEQEAVWDELSRGKNVRQVAGSGMGLSLVRSIIARHGGTVELFSQEGQGTAVRILLPVLAETQNPQVDPYRGGVAAGDIAQSSPVQPFQDPTGAHRRGATPPPQAGTDQPGPYVPGGGFVPPLAHAPEPGQILGTPRRTSRRRLQSVDGELLDTTTGEAFGEPGRQGSGPVPFDSGPYQAFKPPQNQPGRPQQGQPEHGQGAGPARGSGPGRGQDSPAGQPPRNPGTRGSGPAPQGPVPARPPMPPQQDPRSPGGGR
ncbi:ATP-binding protein [Brevibacterium samyangense]|uniref:histidine kinase n=1 Tax=Brevibacterium samyangense TaxID=366888 RepID=A0ABN2TBM2_9MICO